MASDLLIRKLPDDVKARLKRRAERNGRSLAAEARGILETSLAGEPIEVDTSPREGWATRLARLFDGEGVDLWPIIKELREQSSSEPRYMFFAEESSSADGKK